MSQFPQPTRPVHSYDLTPIRFPQASQPVNMDNMYSWSSIPEEGFQFDFPKNLIPPPATAASEEEEKQAFENLTSVISEWYEKLPESIRSQINSEKFNVSGNNNIEQGFQVESTTTLGHNEHLEEFKHKLERFKMKIIDINTSREVNGQTEEPRQKLERFKIRTVQLGEVADKEVKQ